MSEQVSHSQQKPFSGHIGTQNLRPWKRGQSGNPGGRPKGIEARAREFTDKALETLVSALDDPDRRVAIAAASILLDRGWGKPKQMIAGDQDNPVSYVIRGPAPIETTAEWLKQHAPKLIEADASGYSIGPNETT